MPAAWGVIYPTPQPYEPLARKQECWARARHANQLPDLVLFLEHEPTVTLGRRGRTQHLLVPPETLAARGIALHRSARGGDVTYHAPGQLVCYPILRLGALGADAHGYLYNLEELAIRTCSDFGVSAFRVAGKNGAWTKDGKLAAIGFHLRRGITIHGMSFNVNLDLTGFDTIVPCGLVGDPVTSLATILGKRAPALSAVRESMREHFATVFGRPLAPHSPAELEPFCRPPSDHVNPTSATPPT